MIFCCFYACLAYRWAELIQYLYVQLFTNPSQVKDDWAPIQPMNPTNWRSRSKSDTQHYWRSNKSSPQLRHPALLVKLKKCAKSLESVGVDLKERCVTLRRTWLESDCRWYYRPPDWAHASLVPTLYKIGPLITSLRLIDSYGDHCKARSGHLGSPIGIFVPVCTSDSAIRD